MNKSADISNVYELPRVILSPVSDEMQLGENLEPPFVRTRETNSQLIVINMQTENINESPCDQTVYLERAVPRINRLALTFISFRYLSPNINPLNNTFSFIRTGTNFVATIAVDQNLVGIARYNALVAAMNLATGVPGEYAVTAHPTLANTYIISNTLPGTPWRFVNSSNGIKTGRFLWGFNPTNYNVGNEAQSHTLSSYTESYTRWIDVISYEITQFTKIDISGTKIPAECIIRYQLNTTVYGTYDFAAITTLASLNFNRSRSLSVVDIQIRDEFGNILYIPKISWSSFVFNMTLLAQL